MSKTKTLFEQVFFDWSSNEHLDDEYLYDQINNPKTLYDYEL
jgi:hypothetical protein